VQNPSDVAGFTACADAVAAPDAVLVPLAVVLVRAPRDAPLVVADAVAEGAGLTFLASYHAQAYVQAGRLRRVLAAWEPAPIPINIVQPAGRFPAAKVRLFVDHLAADLRRRFGAGRREAEVESSREVLA